MLLINILLIDVSGNPDGDISDHNAEEEEKKQTVHCQCGLQNRGLQNRGLQKRGLQNRMARTLL